MATFSFLSIGYFFYRSVNFDYHKICIRPHCVVPYWSVNVLTKFHGKLSNLHTLLIHLKRRYSLEKRVWVFRLLKIYKHIMPSQRNLSTWKAASKWNNRIPSVHSKQTWALRESDSVTVTFQVHQLYSKWKDMLCQKRNKPRSKCCSAGSRRHKF